MKRVVSDPLPGAPKPLAFSVLRVPFFLEPDYDESKPFIESNRERLIKKWGGKRGWERQKHQHNLKGRGLDAGIPFFNLDRKTSNTMASHRLIQHVGKRYGLGISEALYDRLNVYYFVEGHALNDKPLLAKVAAAEISKALTAASQNSANISGGPMTREYILAFLNGNEGRKEIEDAKQALNQMGVHGIPKFIIEGSTMVDGAAGSDAFVRIFREIERRGEVKRGPVFGAILGVDDELMQRGSHTKETLLADADA